MEVLAIIAYKQPITRAEIDVIRGVDCGGVIDTLTDRKFIKIVGRKETLGKPLLYGTTQEFLRHFGLSHLSELPVIDTVKDILPNQEEKTQELPFDKQEEQIKQEQSLAQSSNHNNQENKIEQVQEQFLSGNNENIQKKQTKQNQEQYFAESNKNTQVYKGQYHQEHLSIGDNEQNNQEMQTLSEDNEQKTQEKQIE